MTETILKLEKICKRFGDVDALNRLDMNVEEGQVYGFLGRNGAGKSTAIQTIMGVSRADQGDIHLFGHIVDDDDPAPRRSIGYVAQDQHFYEWMTPTRLGRFVAPFYPGWDQVEYSRLLKILELPVDRKVLGFSGGMRSKLALALALAHRPELLLLDEPTAGMDAVARREFIDIVRDQAVRGQRTTLFSSHLIDEVEQAADTVGILENGNMRYEGPLQFLKESTHRFAMTSADAAIMPLPRELAEHNGVILRDQSRDGYREIVAQFPDGFLPESEEALPYSAWQTEQKAAWQIEQPSLEDVFVAMVTHSVAI